MWHLEIIVLLIVCLTNNGSCLLQGLYCGTDNCYEVLGVSRDANRDDIAKAYRQLARTWHPDKKKQAEKEHATIMFQKIANAYEILRDEDARKDYDYMLDHPDEYYSNYLKYYRRQMTPKVDPRIVIVVTITIISAIQYLSAVKNHKAAVAYFSTVTKYRIQAMDIAREEGLIDDKSRKDRNKSKMEMKEEEETILRKIIEEKMDIQGGYAKPTWRNVLWGQLLLLPVWLTRYVVWYASWVWRFTIQRQQYGTEEKCFLIRKQLGKSEGEWNALESSVREEMLEQELWIKDKFKEWKKEQEEEMKTKLADNSRYKKYRRYMKKGGPGQMSFGPD